MLLRRADYLTRPWRNGGGVSHEIAWHPEEDWRLGLAEIVRDGSFSDYTGFDPDVSGQSVGTTNRGIDIGAYPLARTLTAGLTFAY